MFCFSLNPLKMLALLSSTLTLILANLSCSKDPNEAANALYVNAVHRVESARNLGSNYADMHIQFEAAKENIETILSKYSSSQTAVAIASGQMLVSGLSQKQLARITELLDTVAKMRKDPLAMARYSVSLMKPGEWKLIYQNALIEKYHTVGNQSMARSCFRDAKSCVGQDSGTELQDWQTCYTLVTAVESDLKVNVLDEIEKISSADYKVQAFVALSKVSAGSGENSQAEEYLKEALKEVNSVGSPQNKASLLIALYGIQAAEKATDDADSVLEMANNVSRNVKDPWTQGYLLAIIADRYASIGQESRASELTQLALKSISDSEKLSFSFADFEKLLKEISYRGFIEKLLTTARNFQSDDSKVEALSEIGSALCRLQLENEATDVLSEALADARGIDKPADRAHALSEVADDIAQCGDTVWTARVLSEAISAWQEPDDDWFRVSPIWKIVSTYLEISHIADALRVAHLEKDPKEQTRLLLDIAKKGFEDGLMKQSFDILTEALHQNAQIEDADSRYRYLAKLGFVLSDVDADSQEDYKRVLNLAVEQTKSDSLVRVLIKGT